MRYLLLALAMLLAGCAEGPGPSPSPTPALPSSPPTPTPSPPAQTWRLGGAWTAEYTQADIDAWCAIAREYGNECVVMESFPPQYAMAFATEADCLEARERILALDHVTARECVPAGEPSAQPDAPVSSGEWSLHGTFTQDFTQDDIEAVCVAGTGEPTCAMMKSYPPQYVFRFATRAECDEARAKILAVASARPDECVAAN
jgi:hypothetical protein